MNFLAIDDTHIQIAFGIFGGVMSYETYATGELKNVKVNEQNMVMTHVGELIPAFTQTHRRKDKPSVTFHRNGLVKDVMLEEQTQVETPIGTLPAEFVTFYETGELHRIFIADGKISGFWTEEEEQEYNIPLNFDLGITQFTSLTNGICFYQSGDIKSITLYPGQSITVGTPAGVVDTKIGFSLYESGNLKSVEPEQPVAIITPIGTLTAYDPNAIGINADSNSLTFDDTGKIKSLKTSANRLLIQTESEEFHILQPQQKQHPLYDDRTILEAMEIEFNYDTGMVKINSDRSYEFALDQIKVTIQPLDTGFLGCTPADCASCSLCHAEATKE